jgi:hypothetical protein
MSRRIEVELTSTRADGTWTWRAAGAKQPKGDLDGSLLYEGAKVGDVVRADADFMIDGIVITAVLPPKGARKEPERLEIIGPPRRDDSLVTTTLAPRGRGGDRRDRGGRDGGRPGGRDGRGDRDRRPRGEGDRPRGEGGERRDRGPRPARPERPAPEPKPKPKRLRAGRAHRNAVLAELPEEQKPVAEQVLRGGIPAVRQAVEKQNEANRAEGKPEINAGPLLAMAEQIMPALRTAEWRDRAEAALADVAELDLRDLRSVVVAADAAARDEETRQLADQLRTALSERVDAEHAAWLAEIDEMLTEGRAVRALRLSSRPPKAGAPFPAELATRLTEAASASLTAETGQERYATVLDALAYSPVRGQVAPQGRPATPSDELMAAVRKVASRLPQVASAFGVEAPAQPTRAGRGRPKPKTRGATPNPLASRKPAPAAKVEGSSAPADAGPAVAAEQATTAAVDAGTGEAPGAPTVPAEAVDAATTLDAGDQLASSSPEAAATGTAPDAVTSPSDSASTDEATPAPADSSTDGSAGETVEAATEATVATEAPADQPAAESVATTDAADATDAPIEGGEAGAGS